MLLQDFQPRPTLETVITPIGQPRFPVVDAHNHLGAVIGRTWDQRPVSELIDILDQSGVHTFVDLDGGWGEDTLNAHLDQFKAYAPDRFQVFGGVDWKMWGKLGNRFPDWAAGRLEIQQKRGAEGLKIWKPFGLTVRDHLDTLVQVDDERLDPIWEAAAALNLPVLIHVADPVAFFQPLDKYNERWEELMAHPDWHFPSPPFPAFLSIVEGLKKLVLRFPTLTFIGAHVGCYAENLIWVSEMLNCCPNYYVDISARIPELGRQPYSARRFLIEHADRILFGTDMDPSPSIYQIFYRFLETDDENFPYTVDDIPDQGRWRVHGLALPDDVLEKIYNGNARKILHLR